MSLSLTLEFIIGIEPPTPHNTCKTHNNDFALVDKTGALVMKTPTLLSGNWRSNFLKQRCRYVCWSYYENGRRKFTPVRSLDLHILKACYLSGLHIEFHVKNGDLADSDT